MPIVADATGIGQQIMTRADELARFSEDGGKLTRCYLTPEHEQVNAQVTKWMKQAGMTTRVDAAGNIVGRYEGTTPDARALMFGSHLDTVRDAGRYDGMLGVITPISCIEVLSKTNTRFPFAIEVIGFGDEEGVRFQSTLLGSRAVAGSFDLTLLTNQDSSGISLAEALDQFGLDAKGITNAKRAADEVLAYVELHIEQGPVLEAENQAVGVVTSIAGATRMSIDIKGVAGHAGTVPMHLRHDALTAACQMVQAVETIASNADLVGTVGQLSVSPGAVNVIPGDVNFSLDVRAGDDSARKSAISEIRQALNDIAEERRVLVDITITHDNESCQCAPWLMDQLEEAARHTVDTVRRLPSGAGHDAMAMITLTDVGMLFVRCEGGVSHHPAENITHEDAAAGAITLLHFIQNFRVN